MARNLRREKATLVLGILRDKEIAEICAALLPIADRLLAMPVPNHRTSRAEEICKAARDVECAVARDLAGGFANRTVDGTPVTGSLFLVGEALALLWFPRERPEISLQ